MFCSTRTDLPAMLLAVRDEVEDAVIGIAVGSDAPIGIGLAHGWHRLEPPMIITKSSGGQIDEIDDEPALDVLLRRNGHPG